MSDLLHPGSSRAGDLLDDEALVRELVRVELAWLRALAASGAATDEDVTAFERAVDGWTPILDPEAVEGAGNPVLPLVTSLRERLDATGTGRDTARRVHTGLTSQDVLDTALVLLARDACTRADSALARSAAALAGLADTHRGTVMAGRTLTQTAVPVTFGLVAAQWLAGVLDARTRLADVAATLPVQCGGAAGTLARLADLVADPLTVARAFADDLGLQWPGLPWHTRRTPVTVLGDALVQTTDALGVVAADVLVLGRPEIGELSEGSAPGRGGSSTMPHKHNPVLSVLVNAAALQAPQLGATLHHCAARSVDQRPDGAWHAEWDTLRRLLTLVVVASDEAAELLEEIVVHADVMQRHAELVAHDLLAERDDDAHGDVGAYLGASDAFVDVALRRLREDHRDA